MVGPILKSNKGMAMILAMMVGVLGMIFGITLWHMSNADALQVKKSETKAQAYYYVQSGLELAMGHILNNGIDYLLDKDANVCLTSDRFYGDLENEKLTNTADEPEIHNLEFVISRHEDKGEGVADEDYDHDDDYFIIESTGIERKSDNSEFTTYKMTFKVYVQDLFYRNITNSGGYGPLDMVFALNEISLLGSGKIIGSVGTNSVEPDSVAFAWSTKLEDGNLHIGPGGDWNKVVKFRDGRGPYDHIPNGKIEELDYIRDYPMPIPPPLPYSDATPKNVLNLTGEDKARISEGGKYSVFNVKNSGVLTIDLNNQNIIIQTDVLEVSGNGKIILNKSSSSTGRLIFHVTDTFTLEGSGTVNHNGNYNDIYMYYSGNQNFIVGGDTKFNGSVYALKSNIEITNSGGFMGNIITGGNNISITGNAEGNVRAIYAPNALLEVTGSGKMRGVAIARNINITGASYIQTVSNINSDFFDHLQWDTEPGGGGSDPGHGDQIETGIKDGSWRKKVTVES